ncbi:hypothetical protein NA56DRAFT_648142 [Hyaloscypha hepaticicola]|uniref:Uncharacterized protein n=1 Tax=Hyaloscypha hepaticicola TaxID=2082293 RepID=A0A2J6PVB4_9HELO|nr:hypothetical protein NA56DRAFT_648142 [Hyaloscypha hepaticicola]
MVTTETYSDPRAKEAASEFDDMLQVTRTTTCQYSRTRATYTEYGTYTRETVQEAPCPCPLAKASAATQESPPSSSSSSWKRKFSFTSPFKRRSSEKRPVDLMVPAPSPQPSPASTKTFFSAIQFHQRPGMTRRNAWIGRPEEIVGEPESVAVLMTSTEQLAVAENHVTFVEPPCEAADAPRRGLIDVKEEVAAQIAEANLMLRGFTKPTSPQKAKSKRFRFRFL